MQDLDKSASAIARMFSAIAGRYDLLNHILSANSDRRWRKIAARCLNGRYRSVLDLATGTGDLAISVESGGRRVVGADFCIDMVALARKKTARRRAGARIAYSAADALALPFPDGCFDAVTVGFGVRNFADLGLGLSEIRRVLKPGGKFLVLEFSQPSGPWGPLFRWYSSRLLPRIGGLLSGSREAYSYLNRSAQSWPGREEFSRVLATSGFSEVAARSLSHGIVALHEAVRP